MKVVLITGVSRGIGYALATQYLDEGTFVVGTGTSGRVDIAHENFLSLQLRLDVAESIRACITEIKKIKKPIDLLINNAGVVYDEDDTVVSAEKLRKTLEVNLVGTADFTEQLLPFIANGGQIINISSSSGSLEKTHHSDYPSYQISKAALNKYTRTLAIRLRDRGIVVSSVHPGWVKTDMGGSDAEITPEDAADDIVQLSKTVKESGQFWFKGKKFPW